MSTLTGQEPNDASGRWLRSTSPLRETLESFLSPLPIPQIRVHKALEDLPVVGREQVNEFKERAKSQRSTMLTVQVLWGCGGACDAGTSSATGRRRSVRSACTRRKRDGAYRGIGRHGIRGTGDCGAEARAARLAAHE